jgi:hypothetical protein
MSGKPLAKLGDALFALPLLHERPTAEHDPMSAEKWNNLLRVIAKVISATSRARPMKRNHRRNRTAV